jgi:CHAD domain-containing protein
VLGAPVERIARGAAQLQGILGDHQDAVVARTWLRAAAAADPSVAFAAGEVATLAAGAASAARAAWPEAWEALQRKRRRWSP